MATFPIIYWKEPEWRVKVPMNEIIIFFINCVPELMMRWQRNCIWHHPILSGILTNKLFFPLSSVSHLSFPFLSFSTNFCPFKSDLSGNTVWPQTSGFQKLVKMDHFWHFYWNVNVARFARKVEWDCFCDFQIPWVSQNHNWLRIDLFLVVMLFIE